MAINKVIYDDDTLIDLTGDTVTPEKLLSGETAHNAAGNRVTGTAVKGHTIQNTSGTALTQRDTLQFKDMAVSDDSTNNKTVVRQTQVVNTEAEWNQMLANDEVDPNVTYYLPWMSTSDYAEDRTPVGTVIQVTGNYDNITTRQKSWYPHLPDSEDYLICNGYQPRIEYYPELFDYFAEVYGSGYYFNDLVPIGRFAVPDFRTDFPTNGMLFIKAKTTSTRITYAEVNDERTTENNVWSAEKVNNTKADNSVIAPVESGTTASQAYAAGAHFIRDSAFCTAKTAIAQGEAFTLNTNYEAETVGARISTIEGAWGSREELMRNTYGVLYGIVHPGLKIAVLNWIGFGTTPNNDTFQAVLSAKYKPVTEFGVPMRNANNLLIQTDSKVTVKLTTLTWSAGTLMYPTV